MQKNGVYIRGKSHNHRKSNAGNLPGPEHGSLRVQHLRVYLKPWDRRSVSWDPPGVQFSDLTEDWICPGCGAGKDQFVIIQTGDTNVIRWGNFL
jgi:rubredoxin